MVEKRNREVQEITAYDFTFGVLRAAANKRRLSILFNGRDPKFHGAMADAYLKLREIESISEIRPDFTIRPHPIYGDSENLNVSIMELCTDGIIDRIRGRHFRFAYQDETTGNINGIRLRGPQFLYDDLGSTFIDSYYKNIEDN